MVREVKSDTIPDLDVLELPYAGDDLSMIIALPKDDIEDADKYIRRFSPKEIVANLANEIYETEVTIPRFEASFDWKDLSVVMKKSGVQTLFDEQRANLSNISDEPLYVTKVNNMMKINHSRPLFVYFRSFQSSLNV